MLRPAAAGQFPQGLKSLCRNLIVVRSSGKNHTKGSPEGAKELSPALQRWVTWEMR
jgi:hypothetical protein